MSGLWQRAKDALAEKRGLLNGATPEPWTVDSGRLIGRDPEPQTLRPDKARSLGVIREPWDAAFITTAVNDYGPMLDALEAVLDRHAPDAGAGPIWCEADAYDWPCTDARAVLTALGVVS